MEGRQVIDNVGKNYLANAGSKIGRVSTETKVMSDSRNLQLDKCCIEYR